MIVSIDINHDIMDYLANFISIYFILVVDVTLIRAFVDLGFDGLSPQQRIPIRVSCKKLQCLMSINDLFYFRVDQT